MGSYEKRFLEGVRGEEGGRLIPVRNSSKSAAYSVNTR